MQDSQKRTQNFIVTQPYTVESILILLRKGFHGIHQDYSTKILKVPNDERIYIPITIRDPNSVEQAIQDMKNSIGSDITIKELPWDNTWAKIPRSASLHDNLLDRIPSPVLEFIPQTFDIIGSLAIIEIDRWGDLSKVVQDPVLMEQYLSLIGNTIIRYHKNITTVLNKVGSVEGEFRLRNYEIIAGEPTTTTIHKENNVKLCVDPTKMFFSPRLSYERDRVASIKFPKDSMIIDCFAGCGPYSIQITHKHRVNVYSIEKNHIAYQYLLKNISLNQNKLKGKIHPYLGDFRDFRESNLGKECINRTNCMIMNLPEHSCAFIPHISPFIKDTGIYLVFYAFFPSSDSLNQVIVKIQALLNEYDLRIVRIKEKRVVFSFSPDQNNVCVDMIIKKAH
ncbi:MAG: hypothetical protein JW776_03655 [Candidatus Lokiarchaeota archaeon]|nr:hypothetical protein [Candidatus Lokiarchaeota archaeon]